MSVVTKRLNASQAIGASSVRVKLASSALSRNLRDQVAFEVEVGLERTRAREHAPDRPGVFAGPDHDTGEMRDLSLRARVQQPSQAVLQFHAHRAARASVAQRRDVVGSEFIQHGHGVAAVRRAVHGFDRDRNAMAACMPLPPSERADLGGTEEIEHRSLSFSLSPRERRGKGGATASVRNPSPARTARRRAGRPCRPRAARRRTRR